MRVLVLEDEPPAREQLLAALRAWDPSVRATCLDTVADAVRHLLAAGEPDLVLADVQLVDGRSLEVFERVPVRCPVIFVTAHDAYLEQALVAGGIDYLYKPVDPERLTRALDKVLRLQAHFAAPTSRYRRRLLVRRGSRTLAVPVEQVAWFHTEHRLVFATLHDGRRHGVDEGLGDLEAALDPRQFFRIHRSVIVQVDAVRGFTPAGKGRLRLQLEPAFDCIVSAERAPAFRRWVAG